MVDDYNKSISNKSTTDPSWEKMDLILDWDEKLVKIYLNNHYKGQTEFY